MNDESTNLGKPATVDRATFQTELDMLRVREKAHTREGDAIAAARRRLPMVEVAADIELIGPHGQVTVEARPTRARPVRRLTWVTTQEPWEDSPPGWPQQWQVDGSNTRTNGRPITQWSRLEAGRSDDLAGG
jgi:hypothetical protein